MSPFISFLQTISYALLSYKFMAFLKILVEYIYMYKYNVYVYTHTHTYI